MRVALVGWETDDAALDALAGLGLEVLAWTRWFPGQEWEERRGGWVRYRCPHHIGGGPDSEAWSFRESVLGRASQAVTPPSAPGFDVVHALDRQARPAAAGLAERWPGCARVAHAMPDDALGPSGSFPADRWIAAHPWLAEHLRHQPGIDPNTVALVPSAAMLRLSPAELGTDRTALGTLIALSVPPGAEVDPGGTARALAELRGEWPALVAAVCGFSPVAEALRRSLAERGLAAPEEAQWSHVLAAEPWAQAIANAKVVGIASQRLAAEPIAWVAWSLGVPVVRLGGSDPRTFADACRAALADSRHFARQVHAGAALAGRRLAPATVAQGWVKAYLDAQILPRLSAPAIKADAPRPILPGARPTRLALVPIGPRELYASWYLRTDDRATALEWLGSDAPYAALVVRLYDITGIRFNGTNAHLSRDFELGQTEHFRALTLENAGCSFAATLGMRSGTGYFHPLAHAGPVHLPREEPATYAPERRLQALRYRR